MNQLPLNWLDALAAVPRGTFTQEEAKAGWPKALKPLQLARLQRPYDHKDDQGARYCGALESAIHAAIKSGELPHTVQQHEHVTPARWEEPSPSERRSMASDGFRTFASARPGNFIPESRQTWQTHHIAPADARDWLATQGEAPSKHVSAWFETYGVAALQSVPVVEPAQITTYAELVQFRLANKAAPWTDGMKAVLTAEERRRTEIPGARGVRKVMGEELGGISDKRIGQLIRGYQETQRRRQATPLRAVGAV